MTITSMKSYAIGYFEEMTVEMNGSNKSFDEIQGWRKENFMVWRIFWISP